MTTTEGAEVLGEYQHDPPNPILKQADTSATVSFNAIHRSKLAYHLSG
jgi:hypothetical protein